MREYPDFQSWRNIGLVSHIRIWFGDVDLDCNKSDCFGDSFRILMKWKDMRIDQFVSLFDICYFWTVYRIEERFIVYQFFDDCGFQIRNYSTVCYNTTSYIIPEIEIITSDIAMLFTMTCNLNFSSSAFLSSTNKSISFPIIYCSISKSKSPTIFQV